MNIVTCLCGREFNASKLRACPACSMPTAQVLQITPDQRRRLNDERQRKREEEERRARLTEEERRQADERSRSEYADAAMARIELTLSEGRTPAVYRSVLMATDYSFMSQVGGTRPDVLPLAELGWDGWEIVGIVPRTTGIALTNLAGGQSFYGGGVGGLTDGAYLLMRLPVTEALFASRREYLIMLLRSMHDGRDSVSSSPAIPLVPPGDMGAGPGSAARGAPAAAAAGGMFIAYGVTHTVYEDSGSDGGEFEGGDFDFG